MTNLFTPIQVGAMALANRIVMAPLTRNRAPGAIPNELMKTYYEQRASAGLIITEATAISHQAQGYADVPGLYGEAHVDGWMACRADFAYRLATQKWRTCCAIGHSR
jgi:N-ethylmaleimide reductase